MKIICRHSINEYSSLLVKKASKGTLKIDYVIHTNQAVLSSLTTENMQFEQSQYLASNATEITRKLRRQISLDIAKKFATEKETYLQNQSQKLAAA